MSVVRRCCALISGLALITTVGVAGAPEAQALSMVDCAALSTPIYQSVNPRTGASLITPSSGEARNAATYGFTDYRGEAFKASKYRTSSSMVGVHRLSKGSDFAFESDPARISALVGSGYSDEGLSFYAAGSSDWCTQTVRVWERQYLHRYAAGDSASNALSADGWQRGPVVFHVAASPRYGAPTVVREAKLSDASTADRKFTFAVIPDTQPEVWRSGDPRFANRSAWLVANKAKYDIRWAIQTGDLVDWDDATHSHYRNAAVGLAPLKRKLPFFLNIGNHDSAATCYGGSACDGRFVPQMARMTRTFNQYFSADDYGAPVGAFEPGKVDNTYSRFKAGNRWWLILNLELWPRASVVEWARALVAKHSKHNVIVATHSFMSSSGTIGTSAQYGSTSPKYLWDTVLKRYKNVKIVLSGHTGSARTDVLRGTQGNKIFSFLTTYHSRTTNPVRLVEVDFARNRLRTWVEAPYTKTRFLSPQSFSAFGYV